VRACGALDRPPDSQQRRKDRRARVDGH
jgi:hypothetical protein